MKKTAILIAILFLFSGYLMAGDDSPSLPRHSGSLTMLLNDDVQTVWGTGSDFVCEYDTAQTPDSMVCGVSSDSRAMILMEKADVNTDMGHAQQTNPTLFIHSADATDTTQWISLAHNQTNGVLDVGKGVVSIPDGISTGAVTAAAGSFTTLSASGLLTLSTTANITASTTQTQGQGALTTTINEVATVANNNDTVTLPAAAAGVIVVIMNNGANTLRVFPASGDNIDGTGVNTQVTQASGANLIYVAHDATNWNRIHGAL